MIGDEDKTEYSDTRLKEIVSVGAFQANVEIDFGVDYTVNIVTPDISPDPTVSPDVDDDFTYLAVLKSACLIDRGNMRIAAMSAGIEAKCGPAVMKTLQRVDGFKTLIEMGYCASYEDLKYEYELGNAAYIRAILSPFVNGEFDAEDYNSSIYSNRTFR
jgi:hypothetical protein